MSDLISRQAAIDIVSGYAEKFNGYIGSPNDSDVYAYARGLLLGIERNINAVPSAQIEQRWIPVTERLPLYGQDVLAVRTYGDGEKCQEVLMAHIAVWNEETGEKWWNATNITHWMPLPEPPKGERKDDDCRKTND